MAGLATPPLLDVAQGKIEKLHGRVVSREVAARLDDLSHLAVRALDRVRRGENPANLWRREETGREVVPPAARGAIMEWRRASGLAVKVASACSAPTSVSTLPRGKSFRTSRPTLPIQGADRSAGRVQGSITVRQMPDRKSVV